MNRIATALSAAIPANPVIVSGSAESRYSRGGDSDGHSVHTHHRDSPRNLSPVDTPGQGASAYTPAVGGHIYDDPRAVHHWGSSSGERAAWPSRLAPDRNSEGEGGSGGRGSGIGLRGHSPRRPGMLRHVSENALHMGPPSRQRSPHGGSPRGKYRDQTVRASLASGAKRSRLTAMVKAPHGERYAVGGGAYLRVLEIYNPKSGSATPTPEKDYRHGRAHSAPLARGTGGVTVEETLNLWKGHWSVGKGVNDLDWGIGSFDTKVVTATPSGNFMVFDVNKGKLERDVSTGQPRPLNCVKLCKVDGQGHLMLTGGTEGQAKIWDLRDRDPHSRKYFKHSVPITALAFAPEEHHSFVVGLDNGTIKRYDIRHATRSIGSVWGAHGTKPVLDLQWKSSFAAEGGWLASAGGDRCVQIWDMSQSWERVPTPVHTLHTAHPLRRIAWRPFHETELITVPLNAPLNTPGEASASTASAAPELADEDAHLEIWDVRRHFVAKYNLPTTDGTPVAVAFGENHDALVTCFQNGVLAQLDTRNVGYPLESVPRQVTSWSSRGEMAYALDKFKIGEIPFDDLKAEYVNHWDKTGRNPKGIADAAYEPLQATAVVSIGDADEEVFRYLAAHYRLEGDAPEKICRWNREIAEECDLHEDARMWSFLKGLVEEFEPTKSARDFNEAIFSSSIAHPPRIPSPLDLSPGNSPLSTPSLRSRPLSPEVSIRIPAIPLDRANDTEFDSSQDAIEELLDPTPSASTSGSITPLKTRFKAFKPPDTRKYSDPRTSISTITPIHVRGSEASTATAKPRTSSTGSDERGRMSSSMMMTSSINRAMYDFPDPYGIAPTGSNSESNSRASPALLPKADGSPHLPADSPKTRPRAGSGFVDSRMGSLERAGKAVPPKMHGEYTMVEWEAYRARRCEPLLEWLKAYVDDGNVQLAATVFMVGRYILEFPTGQCEQIAHAYLDALQRHRLDKVASYVRKHAGFPSLETFPTQDGVTHIAHCQRCHRPTGSLEDIGDKKKRFWWCRKCKLAAKQCSVCREGVRGLWMECGKCHHGGHQRCMRLYYRTSPRRGQLRAVDAELVHGPEGRAPSSTKGSSGVQRAQNDASNDSLNHLAARSSGEMTRDGEEPVGAAHSRGWNVCPTGCGCKCRQVVAPRSKEPD